MHANDLRDDLASINEIRSLQIIGGDHLSSALEETSPETVPITKQRSRRKPATWCLLASFAIEIQAREAGGDRGKVYRTSVHHIETDKDATWEGIEGKKLCAWMLDQLGEDTKLKATQAALDEAGPAPNAPVTMSVTQVLAYQPPFAQTSIGIGRPSYPFQGVLSGVSPFTLEAEFRVADSVSEKIARATAFDVQFFAKDLATGTKTTLGASDTSTLIAGQSVYKARLSDISLAPGTYQIRVVVSLRHALRGAAFLELPLFRVI